MKKILGIVVALALTTPAFGADETGSKVSTPVVPKELVLKEGSTLRMNNYFSSNSTSLLMQKALKINASLKAGEPIYMVLDSGGGSIQAGLEMIDFLSSLGRPVHTITIFAASMGFQTVQGLGDRYLIENGTLMSHKARGGFWGEFPGQLDSRYDRYKRRLVSMEKKVVLRTDGKHTLQSYQDLIENEYWCDGQDCIDQGFADEIVKATCDESLYGIEKDVFFRFLISKSERGDVGGELDFYVVEFVDTYSKCPLITGYLDWNIYIDGKPVYKINPSEDTTTAMNVIKTGNDKLDTAIKEKLKTQIELYNKNKNKVVLTTP